MSPSAALYKVVTTRSGWFFLWAKDYAEAGKLAEKFMVESGREKEDSEIKSITTVVPTNVLIINERS